MLTFDNDEVRYLQWVNANPHGFVINAPKGRGTVVLHKADCEDIATRFKNYTTTTYKKICSLDKQELADWGARHSDKFKLCAHCKP